MKPIKIKTVLKVIGAIGFFGSYALAQVNIEQEGFSLEQTRQFNQSVGTSSGFKMSVASLSDEFDCPLFSNSPYQDIFKALDSLQSAINVFPQCPDGNASVKNLTSLSDDLRKKIIEAKTSQDHGETKKLSISADQMLQAATKLQDYMINITTGPNSNCYKSEGSKNIIFSINDAFQSLAPVALDIASKNPSLATILARNLPVVAGAQAVSKGIGVLEMALKNMTTLDMKDSSNRLAVIKNTCSYMKVYNRIEYLTLDRASQIKKINTDFNLQIQTGLKEKRMASNSLSGFVMADNSVDATLIKIKENIAKNKNFLARAESEINSLTNQSSNRGMCSVVKTVSQLKVSHSLLNDLIKVSEVLGKNDEVVFKKAKLEDYEIELKKIKTSQSLQECAQFGTEWLKVLNEALIEISDLIENYERLNQVSPIESEAKMKIYRADLKINNLQDDLKKMNIFANISTFEPSELAKKINGMPKFLFNGPDGTLIDRVSKSGPVFDLLKNNEDYFKLEINKFNKSIEKLKTFESMMLSQENAAQVRAGSQTVANSYYLTLPQKINTFSHLTDKYLPENSADKKTICSQVIMAITSYVRATDHLLSSEYLCKMIDPVLKETEVSTSLKKYCQNSKGQLINSNVLAGYKQIARSLFIKDGPKDLIETLLKRNDNLRCL